MPKGSGYEIDESVEDKFTYFRNSSEKWRRKFNRKWDIFHEPNWTPNERSIMTEPSKLPAPGADIQTEKQQLNDRLKEIQEREKEAERIRKADSIQRDAQKKIDSLNKRSGAYNSDGENSEGSDVEDEAAAGFSWPEGPFFSSPLELMQHPAATMLI